MPHSSLRVPLRNDEDDQAKARASQHQQAQGAQEEEEEEEEAEEADADDEEPEPARQFEVVDDDDEDNESGSFTLLEEPKPSLASSLKSVLQRVAAVACDVEVNGEPASPHSPSHEPTMVDVAVSPTREQDHDLELALSVDSGSVLFLRDGFGVGAGTAGVAGGAGAAAGVLLSQHEHEAMVAFNEPDCVACNEVNRSFCFDPTGAFEPRKELLNATAAAAPSVGVAARGHHKRRKLQRIHGTVANGLATPTAPEEQDEEELEANHHATSTLSLHQRTCGCSNWIQRIRSNWDSIVISAILTLVIIVFIIMVVVSAVLNKYASDFQYHTRCYVLQGTLPTRVSTGALAVMVTALGEYAVLCLVSFWMALLCSMNTRRLRKHLSENNHFLPNNNLVTAFLLPCYEGIWYAVACLAMLGILVLVCSVYIVHEPNPERLFFYHRDYPCELQRLPFIWILLLLPMLMIQRSVSKLAMRRTIGYAGVLCLAFVVCVCVAVFYQFSQLLMGILMLVVRCVVVAIYFLVKYWFRARSSFDYFYWAALGSSAIRILCTICLLISEDDGMVTVIARSVGMVYDSLMIVPMLLTLRADTKYWLGIDDDPVKVTNPIREYMLVLAERGMITSFSTQTSVYDVHNMIEEHKQNVVDFSRIELYDIIAQGATSIVMRGLLHPLKRSIALKIYTAIQVTEEELERFSRESALLVQLEHPNVVQFYGICVVPPSISLVFEHCTYGSLDVVLDQSVASGQKWDLSTKLKAWLDACRALAYLHSFNPPLLHRDIKPDNYLVAKDFILKLTDFGEANLLRPRSDGTMTIAGTVDFMAPEMILGGKTARYGTEVDVYSLMITLWKIMMPASCPWANRTHLQVYQAVTNGERPFLDPKVIPVKCQQVLKSGWAPNPSDRTPVADMVPVVEQLWMMSLHAKKLPRTKFR